MLVNNPDISGSNVSISNCFYTGMSTNLAHPLWPPPLVADVPRVEKGDASTNAASGGGGTGGHPGMTAAPVPNLPSSHSPMPQSSSGSWDSYTPNSGWQPTNPSPVTATSDDTHWNPAYQPSSSHPAPHVLMEENRFSDFSKTNFAFVSHQGFHPSPLVPHQNEGYNHGSFSHPRSNPQAPTISPTHVHHGVFTSHTSSHNSIGVVPARNGHVNGCNMTPHAQHQIERYGDIPNGMYISHSPYPSPTIRPPPSSSAHSSDITNHPNGQPGYPPQVPHQSLSNSSGYSGQHASVKGDMNWMDPPPSGPQQHNPVKRGLAHEELNLRIKEKILSRQNQQLNENHSNTPSVRQNEEPPSSSTGYFLGLAHPQMNPGGGAKYVNSETNIQNRIEATSVPSMISKQEDHSSCFNLSSHNNGQFHHLPNDHAYTRLSDSSKFQPDKSAKPQIDCKDQPPPCSCFPPDQIPPEQSPYYTQLGAGDSLPSLRKTMEERTGLMGSAIRFEKIIYTGKEGKTEQGCPLAKWIIRRSSYEEKVLCLVKHRTGHRCNSAWIVVVTVAWEGLAIRDADYLYAELVHRLNHYGFPTKRRCATNEEKTCACQGLDPETCGASFSFGCSWSMYYNGCKYARSTNIRKFRLSDPLQEADLEDRLQRFAAAIGPLYKRIAPEAHANQTAFDEEAQDCRIGLGKERPFAGVTACFDFCAHAHKDLHDMNTGCTVVTTLTRHRGITKPDDEQLHVLPLYVLDTSDEWGSVERQQEKVNQGCVEVLNKYHCAMRRHLTPPDTAKCSVNKRKVNLEQASSVLPNGAGFRPDASALQHIAMPVSHLPSTASMAAKVRTLQSSFSRPSYAIHQPNAPRSPFPHWGSSNSYSAWTPTAHYQQYYSSNPQPPSNQWTFNRNPAADPAMAQWWVTNLQSKAPVVSVEQVKDQSIPVITQYSDNEQCFKDPSIGGVAIALTHGSVLFECAKQELHATTALKNPNRRNPTRISLVLYQHRGMNAAKHGFYEYEKKMERKKREAAEEEARRKSMECLTAAGGSCPDSRYPEPGRQFAFQDPFYSFSWTPPPTPQPMLPPIRHAFPHRLSPFDPSSYNF